MIKLQPLSSLTIKHQKLQSPTRPDSCPLRYSSFGHTFLMKQIYLREIRKEKYKNLYKKTVLKDLIATELKYHDRCKKNLMREGRKKSIIGRKVAEFGKVIDYIDDCVFDVNQVVSTKVV